MSTLRVDNLKGKTTDKIVNVFASHNSGTTTTNLEKGLAKAYVQFSDADSTFDETFNTSSTTDNGNGDISYDLASSMSNVNFPARTVVLTQLVKYLGLVALFTET